MTTIVTFFFISILELFDVMQVHKSFRYRYHLYSSAFNKMVGFPLKPRRKFAHRRIKSAPISYHEDYGMDIELNLHVSEKTV